MQDSVMAAFYRAAAGNRWDRVIGAATGSLYSHCELVFGDSVEGISQFCPANPANPDLAACFSASPRDGGVRFKRIDLFEAAGDGRPKWDLVPVPLSSRQAGDVASWCHHHVGDRYDWPGVLSLGLASITLATAEIPDWWFCSEICFRALNSAGFLQFVAAPSRVTPQRFLDLLIGARWALNAKWEAK